MDTRNDASASSGDATGERASDLSHHQTRPVVAVVVPPGPEVLDSLLPPLRAALEGGPAVLPMPAGPADLQERLLAALDPSRPVAADVALVVPTSGSSGEPKGVLLTESALRASVSATLTRLGGPGHWLLALPATHIAGLQVLLRSIVAGTEPVALDLVEGFDPDDFAAATVRLFGRTTGRRYTALVPTQLTRILDAGGAVLDAARAYHAILLGGAAAPEPLLQRAALAGVPIVTTYGMTETAGGCVYDGRALEGVTLRTDTAGRIEIAGPVLAHGYRFADRDEVFSGEVFTTADLGELASDGMLTVHGRVDDVVVSGGVNVPLAAAEAAIAGHAGIREVACVGVPDAEWGQRLVAVVVPRERTEPPTLASVRAHASRRAPSAYAPHDLVTVEALPLLASGKVDRTALARLVSAAPGGGSTADGPIGASIVAPVA